MICLKEGFQVFRLGSKVNKQRIEQFENNAKLQRVRLLKLPPQAIEDHLIVLVQNTDSRV